MESDCISRKAGFSSEFFSFGFSTASLLRFILASYVCLRIMQLHTMGFYLGNVSTRQQSCFEQGVHTNYS
jgi:hypothetical protein